MKVVAYMMDTVAWSKYKDIAGKADYVIGGPTIEMIMDSYNQSYNVQYRTKVIDNEGNVGYQVSKDNGETWQNSCSEMLKGDDLYVIPSKSYTYGMWVASPSAGNNTLLMSVYCSGYVYNNGYSTNSLGFRPLVCLNSSVMLQEENGIYTIQ